MKKYDTIFLDRDGTLNPDPGYISHFNKFNFFPFTINALQTMSSICHGFCIVTNQSGVSRGLIAIEDLQEIHDYIRSEFAKNDIPLFDIYACYDHPVNKTENRKPGTGMYKTAAQEHQLDLCRSLMVGDSGSDIEAGIRLGMDTMLVLTGRGGETLVNCSDQLKPTYVVKNLAIGANLLIA